MALRVFLAAAAAFLGLAGGVSATVSGSNEIVAGIAAALALRGFVLGFDFVAFALGFAAAPVEALGFADKPAGLALPGAVVKVR